MISSGLYFGTSGMVNSENFLRVCGAKNAKEARGASLTGTLLVYMPYLLFASFIGFAGSALIADLGTSDSILPAMINQYTGTVLGAILARGSARRRYGYRGFRHHSHLRYALP